MSEVNIKQVIVMRKDLKMRKGKIAAQAAHASMGAILKMMTVQRDTLEEYQDDNTPVVMEWTTRTLHLPTEHLVNQWLDGSFTKICVTVNSEEELDEIYAMAEEASLPRCKIIDSGKTEFNGVATKTCCAIGPYRDVEIDKITGELPLY